MRIAVALLIGIFTSTSLTSASLGDSYLADSTEGYLEGSTISNGAGGEATACDSCGPCDCLADDCECCDDWCNCQRILGLLPSDHCFDRFISPLSNPFFFEDPRSLTEVRGIFIDNSLPSDLAGGDAQVWAGQVRGRVSDRLSIIAPRLSYLQVNQAGNPTHGFLSAPVGFKYNFIRDVERQLLISAGITYFINGSAGAASNFGDGDFHLFLSGGAEILDDGHWLSASGFRLPSAPFLGTQMWYWSNQWDYEVVNHWYGLVGINWFHWMRSGGVGIPAPVTGLDLINLPIGGIAGKDVVTTVIGAKWKPGAHCELGSGFEFPLTNRTDILHNRLYADVIFRY